VCGCCCVSYVMREWLLCKWCPLASCTHLWLGVTWGLPPSFALSYLFLLEFWPPVGSWWFDLLCLCAVMACMSLVKRTFRSLSEKVAELKTKSALVVELSFSKVNLRILRYFPVFYWLFSRKFDTSVTVWNHNVIFWASTEETKFFVWTSSLYFYSRRS